MTWTMEDPDFWSILEVEKNIELEQFIL